MTGRRYPIGIQTFSEIIRNGYVYVDKTDLVWQLAHYAKYIFLSRPRRFGKSLLTTTLESYFRGEHDLFNGLNIMNLEQEWQQYPVIRIDLSEAKDAGSEEELIDKLLLLLTDYTDVYGKREEEKTPGGILRGVIRRANENTGHQVVVLIDEYDAPLLGVLHDDTRLQPFRRVLQEFYQPLKASEAMIKFCFITGITKFSQLSIFSTINNLTNVTMDPVFSNICGITEDDLLTVLREDIEMLAQETFMSFEAMHQKLKLRYDGYHFTKNPTDVYNPFSLLKAFQQREVANYWFESGTPTFLIRQMQHFRTDIMSLDRMEVPSSAFDQPTENMKDALPLLYQSGYLTIKDYDHEGEVYTLSIPNQEVRIGYAKGLLPVYTGLEAGRVKAGFAMKFWLALKKGDVDLAMREMQVYLAGISLTPGPSPKERGVYTSSAEGSTVKSNHSPLLGRGVGGEAEKFYEYTMYLIFSMLNVYVRTQVKCAGGRVDMVVWMPDTTYVFEMKVHDTAQHALEQIDSHGYAIPYEADGRRVVKVGVKFNADTRAPEEWVVAE